MRASLAVAITACAALLGLLRPAAAASDWDEIVAAANKEGEVDVHGGPGKLYEETLTQGFQRAYPQIRINFSGFSGRDAIPKIAPGYGTVSLMDRSPHPNAAKVYINWLLSRAGQTDWARFGHNSRRLDVPKGEPDYFPKAGVAYISEQSEEYMGLREKANAIAKKFIRAEP